ncbi:bifunctional diaminohydroxyphosphoribosylaminopyrimidine deaminase/5-amino-6-(5-phosphoribosylamino)uracil reductase RibD, partial [Catenulispora sp. NL8]
MADAAEVWAMRRAIHLAEPTVGSTGPNSPAGCVVLSAAGELVGEGCHRGPNTPHAVAAALAEAGYRARGGTAVVTLEPCSGNRSTRPCAEALVDYGIKRLSYAVSDPFSTDPDRLDLLHSHGIGVERGLLAQDVVESNVMWLSAARSSRPFVTWKFASTIDGRTASVNGSARWITGIEARHDARLHRARHDAVLVGTGTLHCDDPHLGLRHAVGSQPLRVVLDPRGRIRPEARVLDDSAPTLVITADGAAKPALP